MYTQKNDILPVGSFSYGRERTAYDKDLTVLSAIPQWIGKNLQGRSVILDAKCTCGDGTYTDIEFQRADDDDHQRRVRYNGAILTANVSDPGIKFKKIPDVCIVYISTFDLFKGNSPLYHIDRIIRETGKIAHNQQISKNIRVQAAF